jgi:acyl-CoA reductase-like NAD-dependent aldehyde dehydrogenase
MFRVEPRTGGAPHGGATFERRHPMTLETVTVASDMRAEDARAAVEAAARAFPAWSALGPASRRRHLANGAAAIRGRAAEFVERATRETGATTGWGHFNVELAARMLDEAAALTTQVNGETLPSDHAGTLSMTVRRPVGVVLGIAPWNAPVILGVRAIATPLACGNTVVLKASEVCPATHALIAEVLREAGLPGGVLQVVTHSAEHAPEVVEALIAHPAVRRVNFTGSTRVGRIVAELAGRHLKPAVLELGGKAPMVVLDDADLDRAVDGAVFAAFLHQGQICMSTERIIIDRKVADEFVGQLQKRVQALIVGAPGDDKAQLGPVVDERTVARLRTLLDDATEKGAHVVTGGTSQGVLFRPTVVDFVTRDMRIFHEESFGPVVSVTRVSSDEEAVAAANDSEYGLSAAVFGSDLGRALQVAERIDSGICHINGPSVQDEPQMPFGGVKGSGYGRFGGRAGVHEFTELRWLSIALEPRHYPF